MSMEKLSFQLEEIMTRHVGLYRDMITLLKSERSALENHSFEDIHSSIKEKGELAHKIKSLEGRRIELIGDISEKTGIGSEKLTLRRLANHLGGAAKERLLILRKWLNENVSAVVEMNEFNRDLIDRIMRLNYNSALSVKELIRPGLTYQKGGLGGVSLGSGELVSQTM